MDGGILVAPIAPAQWRQLMAIAIVCALFYTLGILHGFYNGPVYRAGPAYFWLADITRWVVLPVICLSALTRRCRIVPSSYGLVWPSSKRSQDALLIWCVVAAVLIDAAYYGVAGPLWKHGGFTRPAFTYNETIPTGVVAHGLVVMYYAATAGVVEEVVYRGLMWLGISMIVTPRFAKPAYVLVSSLLFASIHWANGVPELAATFAVGVVAALLYLRIGNLWPLVIGHTVTDLIDFG